MVPNVSVRTYRPRQMAASRVRQQPKSRFHVRLSGRVWRFLAVVCLLALLAGLLVTQYFYGQMMDMRVQVEQLRDVHGRMYDQSVTLRANRAQLNSKDHIAAVAAVQLNLFTPDQRQVRRM